MPTTWAAGANGGLAPSGAKDSDPTPPYRPWWSRFGDATLADLVERSLLGSTEVAGARAALLQAGALRDGAAAALAPTLDTSASVQRSRVGQAPAVNRVQLGLNAAWWPDLSGQRRHTLAASDATARASAADLVDLQRNLAAETALAYIALRAAQARYAIAADNLRSQQDTLQITEWRRQAGLVTELETEQARTASEQTRASLPLLRNAIDLNRHALAVATGQPPAALDAELAGEPAGPPATAAGAGAGAGATVAATPPPPRAASPAPPRRPSAAESAAPGPAGSAGGTPAPSLRTPLSTDDLRLPIPAETLRRRPDVQAAELLVQAAAARVGAAEAARLPSLGLSGSIGLEALTLGALTNSAALLRSALASVSLPLLDGGGARAQVRAQEAALAQAQAAWRGSVLGALREVEDALSALRDDRERLLRLQAAERAAVNADTLARQRYAAGLVDFQVVLNTQRAQLSTQDSVASAAADLGSDQVRLYRALGGDRAPAPLTPTPTPTHTPAPPSATGPSRVDETPR